MQSIDQEGKTVEEALEKALVALHRTQDDVEYEVLDEGSKGVLGVGARPILIRVRAKEIAELGELKNLANKFLVELEVDFSNLEVTLHKSDVLKISMDTEDAGILIGKYGQTLESLQYIFNQIMHEKKYKIMVDVSNYREKQNSKLIETVKKIASSVMQTSRRITLKPMTAFERRMVHEAVKDFPELATKSIGIDPERRVVISLVNAPEYDESTENRQERPYRQNSYRPGGGQNRNSAGGGYKPRNPNYAGNSAGGGYKPRNPNYAGNSTGGGYNNQNNTGEGGYKPRNPNYAGNSAGGGYNNQNNTGGYNNQSNPGNDARRGNYGQPGGGYNQKKQYEYTDNNKPDPNNV